MRKPSCLSCESVIDHCHGTLIIHPARIAECTDLDCLDLTHARHAFVIDCADIAGGCPCTAQTPTRVTG
ncbi:hypothetical protein [Nocardia sp. NPDC050710]|uniref:hypothetical protein n=1 Tax=Nocardia sp. NPDC050710 TaxID=3157220 RepID=UPI0033C2C3E8